MKTSRLGFRQWHPDDISNAISLWGDREGTRHFDARGKLCQDEAQERLAKEITNQKNHGVQYWPIFLIESNAHVGCCGLRPYDLSKQIYEIGFHICSNHWRHGYGREAAVAIIGYAFNTIKAYALFAGHNPKNDLLQNLLEQLGFCYTHDEYYPPTGLNHPSYLLKVNGYHSHRQSFSNQRDTNMKFIIGYLG